MIKEKGLSQQLTFVMTQRRQDEAAILAQAMREGIQIMYKEALIEAYLLGQIDREEILAELGADQLTEIDYQRDSLQRDIEWGLNA